MQQDSANYCEGFKPIIAATPHWMILGTMPSVKSLEQSFYYAHPRNAFWPIMHSLAGLPVNSIQEKTYLVKQIGLVLWDVLQACERRGSLDSAIQEPVANDFEGLFAKCPELEVIVFNGKKAQQLFEKHVVKSQVLPEGLKYIVLPSTSPANAMMSFEDKRLFWQEKLSHLV